MKEDGDIDILLEDLKKLGFPDGDDLFVFGEDVSINVITIADYFKGCLSLSLISTDLLENTDVAIEI